VSVPDITPTVEQVSALERTRTVGEGGADLGVFNSETRPTDTEVLTVAAIAVEMLDSQPAWLQTQAVATILTCLLIEESYFRDATQIAMYRDLLMRLGFIIRVGGSGGGDPVEERRLDTVMMRPGMTEYDPWYPLPVPVPNWPVDGMNV
jgi:hypothetical protein